MASNLAAPQPETPASLPSPPFVTMKGIPNFREVGGYPISNEPGKSLRRGLLFRCAEPTKATPEDLEVIRSLGINRIYDLRSMPEIRKHQVANVANGIAGAPYEWEGIERVYAPVFPDESWDPVSMAVRHKEYQKEGPEGMTNAYRTIASEGSKSFGMIVRQILAHPPPGNGFIIHCTAGKDRTGVLAALLLEFAGVPESYILKDYDLTNVGLGKWLDYLVQIVQKQTNSSEESARRMASARPDSMAGFLAWLRTQGGAATYFQNECGLSSSELAQLKQILIADEPPLLK
ncbi:uncharacterized protein PV09_02861 [Verruconis gallopava]|uniref:Tyrosine specific protein phosphatases domain-containing protein n=1 Tax=Verruconis gallopava TaxID=253628 RepID=A0A0D2AHN0_9PEZI|nr:uncharacterized protein PV09_02861 [Verruconis gallopava]KIW06408.1 hypothetical protein PV09_02861 [Verruconis gallopava]